MTARKSEEDFGEIIVSNFNCLQDTKVFNIKLLKDLLGSLLQSAITADSEACSARSNFVRYIERIH